jgi:uncharacterized protein YyaL (SSP411 family)
VAARTLLRLHHYTENADYLTRAEAILRLYAGVMPEQPFGFANLLCAVDLYTQKPHEIVVVATADTPGRDALLEQVRRAYVPNRTLTVVDPVRGNALPELLQGKGQLDGKPTVYVCRSMTCSAPVTTWAELQPLLGSPAVSIS